MWSQVFLPREAADCTMMDKSHHTAPLFSMMDGLKLLMLRWYLFLRHNYDVVESIVACEGGE